jgi:4-hydroxybenzoate polyprenyltransferase
MVGLGRLLRLSLAPSAAADVAAGVLLAHGGSWPSGVAPFALMGASLFVLHGGLALNDWADRVQDARLRPTRPIPAGQVAPALALGLGLALLLLGPLIAHAVAPQSGMVLAVVAALALLYDLGPRGAIAGPLLLALCRAGNLSSGLSSAWMSGADAAVAQGLPLVACYAGYVFAVARMGRWEDVLDESRIGRSPARACGLLAGLLLVLPLLVPAGERPMYGVDGLRFAPALAVAALGALALGRLAGRRAAWSRAEVLAAMGVALRRLLVFTSSVALATGTRDGAWVAAAILSGLPLSWALRRAFPPS